MMSGDASLQRDGRRCRLWTAGAPPVRQLLCRLTTLARQRGQQRLSPHISARCQRPPRCAAIALRLVPAPGRPVRCVAMGPHQAVRGALAVHQRPADPGVLHQRQSHRQTLLRLPAGKHSRSSGELTATTIDRRRRCLLALRPSEAQTVVLALSLARLGASPNQPWWRGLQLQATYAPPTNCGRRAGRRLLNVLQRGREA